MGKKGTTIPQRPIPIYKPTVSPPSPPPGKSIQFSGDTFAKIIRTQKGWGS